MISVIVPVYNVNKYLRKCIDSIINQTYTDLEIILIDDGSTDGSEKICDEYLLADNRVSVIHKENGGLSDARNAGIDVAKGEYLSFIDSDDYIHTSMYEILLSNLESKQADISVVTVKRIKENDEVVPDTYNDICVFEGDEVMGRLVDSDIDTVVACNKLYKKELFLNYRYKNDCIHEDEYAIHHILHNCKRIVYTTAELYMYVDRSGSLSNHITEKSQMDNIEAKEDRLEFCNKYGYEELYKITGQNYIRTITEFYKTINSRELKKTLKGKLSRYLPDFEENHIIKHRYAMICRIWLSNVTIGEFLFQINDKIHRWRN